jgi:hypothetical protein
MNLYYPIYLKISSYTAYGRYCRLPMTDFCHLANSVATRLGKISGYTCLLTELRISGCNHQFSFCM